MAAAWSRVKDAWYGPLWSPVEVDSVQLGHLEVNVDDVRDTMKALDAHTWTQAGPTQSVTRRIEAVVLRASDGRQYTVDQVDQVPLFAWRDSVIEAYVVENGSKLPLIRVDFHRHVPTGIAIVGSATEAERRQLFELVVDAVATGARRRWCPRSRRFLALGAAIVLLLALWLLSWRTSAQSVPTALLTGVLAATAGWTVIDRLSRPKGESWADRSRVTITTTSRELMDQRRHDTRRDLKVGTSVAVVGVLAGVLLTKWLGL